MASGLLQYPFPDMPSFLEGIVTNVDSKRFVCTVKTFRGQVLSNVGWVRQPGSFDTPVVGTKVLLTTAVGYPIVLGELPKLEEVEYLRHISNESLGYVDSGNLTPNKSNKSPAINKPVDFFTGDKILSSSKGSSSFLGILRTGSLLLHSSPFAQILVSKLGRLVRVVGGTYQRFSDASSRVSSGVKGRLYEWFGVDTSLLRGKAGAERYNEAYGDVAAAEVLLGNPLSDESILPEKDSRVRKYWLKNEAGHEVMVETLFEDGKVILNVNSPGDTTVTQSESLWESKVLSSPGGSGSRVTLTPDSIVVDFQGSDTILTINSSGTDLTSKGHFVRVSSSGVHLG